MNRNKSNGAIYAVARVFFETIHLLRCFIKAISIETYYIIFFCCCLIACANWLHQMAKEQNANYINIMNATIEDRPDVLGNDVWTSKDYSTRYLVSQFKNKDNIAKDADLNLHDSLTTKAPSIESVLIYLSYTNLNEEEKLLNELHTKQIYNISDYLIYRYLDQAFRDIEEGDYYSANKLMNRYYKLWERYNEAQVLKTDNNYTYLIRLLLQNRWELSCNRKTAKEIMDITNKQTALKENYNLASIYTAQNNTFNEYLSYLSGIELINNKYYTAAYKHFNELYSKSSDNMLKEYSAFMAIRSAFWIFDIERTKENRKIFIDTYNQYVETIHINYLKSDIKYYNMIASKINIL